MRVLARREPVSARMARLVVTPARAATDAVVSTKSSAPSPDEQDGVRRAATHRATRRRRRVLGLLLLALAGVVTACVLRRLAVPYVAIPAALLVAWLITCRFMVRRERAWRPLVHSGGDDHAAAATVEDAEDTSATPEADVAESAG